MLATQGFGTGAIATWGWTPSSVITAVVVLAPGWTVPEQQRVQTIEAAIYALGTNINTLLPIGSAQALTSLEQRKIHSVNDRITILWAKVMGLIEEKKISG